MAKNRADVNTIHEKIFNKYGCNILDIPWGELLVFRRKFCNTYAFKKSYVSFLQREKGIFVDFKTGKVNPSKRCEKCWVEHPKLYRFKGAEICENCLNPEIDPPEIQCGSSHMGHW